MAPWKPPPPKLCSLCEKKVYPTEERYVDGQLFHVACFRCNTCNKVLSLSEYASHRVGGGLALFCKPHFRQGFLERGRYDLVAQSPNGVAADHDPHGITPVKTYMPSGISLFAEVDMASPPPKGPPPKRKEAERSADAFTSGFPPEWQPAGVVTRMGAAPCTACTRPVFAIGRVQTASGNFHSDCFRCTTCNELLRPALASQDEEGRLACMRHASRQARLSSA